MHEYSLVQSLLDRIDREARAHHASAVKRVRVRLGAVSGVESELFSTAYDLCREGTLCASADLEIVPVAARWSCPSCGGAIAPGAELSCPGCRAPATLVAGDDLVLEQIELEVPDV